MANEWNTAYPIDHTKIGSIPGEIRTLKTSAKTQIDREHETPPDGDATGGEHSNGSAVAYEGTSTPTNRPDGATALADNAIDRGRLWLDDNTDPPSLKRWNGSAWEKAAGSNFGAWASKVVGTAYLAASDGFVMAYGTPYGDTASVSRMEALTDGSNPPTTVRGRCFDNGGNLAEGSILMPVRNGDYWKVTGADVVFWLPIGV